MPILSILTSFYTTLVVNVISWNKAYAVFPQPSFVHHRTYLLKNMTDHFGRLLCKYGKRGWTSQGTLWLEDEASHKSMLEPRRLGDKWSWTIPFDQTGVSRPSTPDSVLEFSTFDLDKQTHSQPNPGHYIIQARVFRSVALKYHYVIPTRYRNEREFWIEFAAPKLESLSMMELWKMPPELRPARVQDKIDEAWSGAHDPNPANSVSLYTLEGNLRDLQLPCYDHEILGWYAEWEKKPSSRVEKAESD